MDVMEAIETRLELRDYADEPVDDEIKRTVLDAGRLAASGSNLQHWRFILVDDRDALEGLADRSPTGGWVANADFAVVILTDAEKAFNEIDAGRAATHMQLAAWERGVGSRLYTVDQPAVLEYLEVPEDFDLTLVLGFGYPDREIKGVKDREPLETIAFRGTFGAPLDL